MYELSDEQYQRLKRAKGLIAWYQTKDVGAWAILSDLIAELDAQFNESLEKRAALEREFGPNANREFEANPSS